MLFNIKDTWSFIVTCTELQSKRGDVKFKLSVCRPTVVLGRCVVVVVVGGAVYENTFVCLVFGNKDCVFVLVRRGL